MEPHKSTLLLTGTPGVGKTTVIRRVAERFADVRLGGFYTEEMREGGVREGFRLVGFDGSERVLAHVDFSGPRVSKYGVDVAVLDAVAESLLAPRAELQLYLVDEIGKMECFSERFVSAMRNLLGSGQLVVATVAVKGGGFIAEAKRRPDVEIMEVTRANRDRVPEQIITWLADRGVVSR
jgi:nucleoside-triphosphatase